MEHLKSVSNYVAYEALGTYNSMSQCSIILPLVCISKLGTDTIYLLFIKLYFTYQSSCKDCCQHHHIDKLWNSHPAKSVPGCRQLPCTHRKLQYKNTCTCTCMSKQFTIHLKSNNILYIQTTYGEHDIFKIWCQNICAEQHFGLHKILIWSFTLES